MSKFRREMSLLYFTENISDTSQHAYKTAFPVKNIRKESIERCIRKHPASFYFSFKNEKPFFGFGERLKRRSVCFVFGITMKNGSMSTALPAGHDIQRNKTMYELQGQRT